MNSRYIPITQQPYCCVAACIQMVLYRKNIPLVPQELIVYHLGLAVPEKDEHLFEKTHVREKGRKGWGVQLSWEKYSLDACFQALSIPLRARFYMSSDIPSIADLQETLTALAAEGCDVFLCFAYEELWGVAGEASHVCVFDKIIGDTVWMIDPEQEVLKFRKTTVSKLYAALRKNGTDAFHGLFLLEDVK
jgi:hypothetical protein